MTDITLEQRARDMWADALLAEGQTTRAAAIIAGFRLDRTDLAAVSAIKAALRLPAGADWQPIETAPKDEWVLISDRAGNVYAAHKQFGYWHAWFDYREDLTIDSPTHWQPLPAAPRHETGEG